MEQAASLLLHAKRLTAVARVKRDDAASIQADGQFATALHKLRAKFPELQNQLARRTALCVAGVPVAMPADLDRPLNRLRKHLSDIGRPTPQFMTSRSLELDANISVLRHSCDEAWRQWAEGQIATLVVEPGLSIGNRGDAVKAKIAELALAAAKPFDPFSLRLFLLALDSARDLIADLREPVSADEVIARITSGQLCFADLNDEEIEVLRDSEQHARRVRLTAR